MLMVHWLFLSLILFAGIAQSQQSQETPRIEAKVQTKNTVPPEQNPKADFKNPMATAVNTSNAESTDHAKNAGDEGTEFWSPFFGYRLKITDTLLVAFTAFLFAATVFLYRATRDMVKGVEDTTKRQLRAYLCVNVHSAHYQLSGTKLHLAARPLLINTGCTPAHKVGCVIKADVFPFPLPKAFLLPSAELILDAVGLLGPQQTFVLGAVVDAGYDSAEIETIKAGHEKRLYVWGTVTYRDIFGDKQHTNFCHSIKWVPLVGGGERIGGSYCSQHSDAS